ncbi:M14 family metallopeptidase [Mesohalobacter halotolerans]|uniref:Uncharacterized protein n=1 Tax=Mesohalobacter halotolerans TaxID=1883405 RepID=A0A4U5TPB0_9FLAO|nr:M14 family metallopeptidase [Mesohalobacter halotolerans]MBS3737869.1 M14 family metallopeptidase [Psychroflexus sp.]TKS55511.1 hypothetical protein FCN74_11195 [Mesohalobacter halotolerans]
MMVKIRLFLLLTTLLLLYSCDNTKSKKFDYKIRFEYSKGQETATYDEMIAFYKSAEENSANVKLQTFGQTDIGLPLYLVTYKSPKADDNALHLLINNGIHPGEPDGIDASMLLLRDIINKKNDFSDNVILHLIPAYNLGGMLNRNSTTRANQNGPKAYGFRGNAKNYDLNRDFIKMNTKNMEAFAKIYHSINPDVYVETHVSNGADYQYTLTHLLTQHNRLGHSLGNFIENDFKPNLEQNLNDKKLLITPYVNVFGRTPEAGFSQFLDSPRYSTGYTSLWNTLGLMIETHMLKPYDERVYKTKSMLESIIELSSIHEDNIKLSRQNNFKNFKKDEFYKFNYVVDSTQFEILDFKGFEAEYINSEITNQKRLKYDTTQPFVKPVKYFNHYKALDSIRIPDYYIVKSAWTKIIEKLNINQVKMQQLKKDTLIKVDCYRIKDYKTVNSPYEGHYLHYKTKVTTVKDSVDLKKGDWLVPTHQSARKYVIEVLEPELKDSFFNWNFFDSILQRKEGFSAYVFEDYAEEFLKNNPDVKLDFIMKKASDENFRNNAYAQLNWLYQQSPLYEKAHLRYPIFRVFD